MHGTGRLNLLLFDQVMDMLLKTQTEGGEMSDDDPQLSYMISAWARICKILGKQFQPYLPLVMGPVLKAASMKPEVALLDADDLKSVEGESLCILSSKIDIICPSYRSIPVN